MAVRDRIPYFRNSANKQKSGFSQKIASAVGRMAEPFRNPNVKRFQSLASMSSFFSSIMGEDQPANYEALIKVHDNSVWVYRSVNIIGNTLASIPINWFVVSQNGERQQVFDGPAALMRKPNPWMTQNFLTTLTFMYLDMTGNAYWEIVKDTTGTPIALFPLRPDRVKIIPDKDNYILGYIHEVNSQRIVLDADDVVHFSNPNLDNDFYGQGAMRSAFLPAQNDLSAQKWNIAYFKNGAHHSGAFMVEESMGQDEYDRLKEELNAKNTGEENWHNILVLEGKATYESLNDTIKDMDFTGLRKMSREEIIAAFGVPPALVGLFEFANYANVKEQIKIFWQYVADPKLKAFSEQLALDFGSLFPQPSNGELVAIPDFSNVEALQEDKQLQAERHKIYVELDVLTVNDVRRDLNLDPVPWGDVPRSSVMAPITLGQQAERLKLISPNLRTPAINPNGKKRELPRRLNRARLSTDLRKLLNGYALGTSKALIKELEDLMPALNSRFSLRSEENPKPTDEDAEWLAGQLGELSFFSSITEDLLDPFSDEQVIIYNKEATLSTSKLVASAEKSLNKSIAMSAVRAQFKQFNLTNRSILNQLALRELRVQNSFEIELYGNYQKLFLDEYFNAAQGIINETLRTDKFFDGVLKTFNRTGKAKALEIARTEMASVINLADRDVYRENGFPKFEWAHSGNPNERENHLQLDGKVADTSIGEGFNVVDSTVEIGGVEGPHDTSLGPEETINCDCDTQPVADRILPDELWEGEDT